MQNNEKKLSDLKLCAPSSTLFLKQDFFSYAHIKELTQKYLPNAIKGHPPERKMSSQKKEEKKRIKLYCYVKIIKI